MKNEIASILDEIYTDPNGIELDEMLADILKVIAERDKKLSEKMDQLIVNATNDIMTEGETLIGYARGVDDAKTLLDEAE